MDSLKDHSGIKHSQEFSADVAAQMRLGHSVVMKAPLKPVLNFLGNSTAGLRGRFLKQLRQPRPNAK
jgi:hypothetical protein